MNAVPCGAGLDVRLGCDRSWGLRGQRVLQWKSGCEPGSKLDQVSTWEHATGRESFGGEESSQAYLGWDPRLDFRNTGYSLSESCGQIPLADKWIQPAVSQQLLSSRGLIEALHTSIPIGDSRDKETVKMSQ